MGVLRFFRRLGLKSILSSALTLEQDIYNLYASLKEELDELEVPPSIVRIVDEEAGHQSLIRDMIANRMSNEEMERILEGGNLHIHDPQALEPLSKSRYGPVLRRLEIILEREREIYDLFTGLHRKSKIPFIRRAFRFLKEQEQTHVLLLERLLNKPRS
ncbi:MAG: ferritin family protein [Spirochaetia bacterium]